MRHGILLALLCGGLVLFTGCEQVLLVGTPEQSPPAVFDALWEDVGARYSYFAEKNIDWDSIRAVYRPRVDDEMGEEALFDLLAEMLFTLEDGHVNLTASLDRSRNWEWFWDYPPNFDANIVERHYLGRDFRQIGPFRTQLLNDVLYVYYGSFAGTPSTAHLDVLMEAAAGTRGVIIDIRNNGGGSLQNARRIAACFTTESTVYARYRTKTGPGPAAFSPWEDQRIEPRSGSRYPGRVAVLTNRRSYSAANAFAQMARVLPQVTLIGDRSGGGGGTPAYGELPNGWTYRFSATQSISPDGEHLEFGVPPAIAVDLLPEDKAAGIDTIIERALEWLRR